MFPEILALHVADGATIADVTYGKGVFWQNVDADRYQLLATDLQTGVDCRELPYDDASLDCVVLDPPYMEGLFRRAGSQLAGGGTPRRLSRPLLERQADRRRAQVSRGGARPVLPRRRRSPPRAQARAAC